MRIPSSAYHRLEIRTSSITSFPCVRAQNLHLCLHFGEVFQVLQPLRAQDFLEKAAGSAGLKQCYQVTLKIIRFRKSLKPAASLCPSLCLAVFITLMMKTPFSQSQFVFFMELLFHSRRWKRRIFLPLCSVLSWWELGQSHNPFLLVLGGITSRFVVNF